MVFQTSNVTSLDSPILTDTTVSLAPQGSDVQPPSPEVADRRAYKAAAGGLGKYLKADQLELRQQILDNQEDRIRTQAAAEYDVERTQKVNDDIRELANKKGGPLDPEEVWNVISPYNINAKTDPQSIIERAYATNFVSSLNTAAGYMQDSSYADARLALPKQAKDTDNKATDLETKRQVLQTKVENLEQGVKQQSYVGYGIDQLKNLSQFYQEAKTRSAIGWTGALGYGSNIKAFADKLFALPQDEFTKKLSFLDEMAKDNPSLAVDVGHRLLGQSISDEHLSNLFTVLAPLDVYEGSKLGVNVLKKLAQYNEIQGAVKTLLKNGAKNKDIPTNVPWTAEGPNPVPSVWTGETGVDVFGNPSKATVAEASGNIGQAAVSHVAQNVTNAIQGTVDASKLTAETMTENFSKDIVSVGQRIGSMARELVTRLQDHLITATENIPSTILEANRIQRLPLLLEGEERIGKLKDAIREFYKGATNTLADISTPVLNRFTNTYDYVLKIVNHSGELFSNPETARNFAKYYGYTNARIVSEKGILASSRSEAIEKKIRDTEALRNEYQQTIEKHKRTLAKGGLTPEETKKLKEEIRGIQDVGVNKKVDELNKLYLQREALGNTVGPQIRQQGVGYYIEVTRPLDETMPVVRDLMIKDTSGSTVTDSVSTSQTTGMNSWKNALLGWVRSPEDTLAKRELEQRKAAVYGNAVLEKLADELGRSIENLSRGIITFDEKTGKEIPWYINRPRAWFGKLSSRQVYKEWERAVDFARHDVDPRTGLQGYFKQNVEELQDLYQTMFNRLPSYAETEAYFSKVELDEFHRVLTNIAEYRNKARLGTEQHAVTYTNLGTRVVSPYFDGVNRKDFPGGDGSIVVMDSSSGKASRVYSLAGTNIPPLLRKRWIDGVASGKYKVVEVYDPELRPLKGFANIGDERIQYILSDAIDSKPISYQQVNRRGGGHFEYDYEHYLKQARVKRDIIGNKVIDHYEGDTTVMPVDNRAMGRDIGLKLDTVRKLIKEDRLAEARDYTRTNLMMSFDEVHSWFKPGRGPDGNILPPRLSVDEPFYVVPRGKSIYDLDTSLEQRYQGTWRDGTRHGSLARQYQVAYTKERDSFGLKTLKDTGTKGNPLYAYEPAQLVAAMPTMQRALNRAMKSFFMDDYKIYAVEHWLREAEPYFKNAGEAFSDIRSSPFYHFNNPEFKSGTPTDIQHNLMSNRYKIQQFIGVPNKFDNFMHGIAQQLVDATYVRFGPTEAKRLSEIRSTKDLVIVPTRLLMNVKEPITWMRSVVFNEKLGLFNIPQILVQAQTHATIWALEPQHGTVGMFGMLLHQWSRYAGHEEILRALDEYATKLNIGSNFKPGEWLEARKELAKTGFEHVGGEYAIKDDFFNHKFIKNDFDNFLSAGQVFFKEGEKSTRLTAWYTAFRKFREENPTGLLTQADRNKILQEADLLTTNMSRASSSVLHGGVLSVTTQFLSYQLRLAELFLSKRIGETPWDRAMARLRLFGMYSGLYGVPCAFGLTGLPISTDIREAAIDHGYVMGDNFVSSLLMEGIPSIITALVTGEGSLQKGKFYNIGDRYGAQGFTSLREALRSDGAWWRILGGASVSSFANTIVSADGATKALWSFLKRDSSDARFALKSDDIVDMAKEISSVNAFWKLWVAMNTGKLLAKNEGYITDVAKPESIFMTLTGLSPQEQDDIYAKGNIVKARKESQKYALQKFIEEIHRGIQAAEDNDRESAHQYWNRAFYYLDVTGYPDELKAQAISIASKNWESRIERADFDFYLKDVPTDRKEQYLETFKNQARLNDYRKQ
jgi:hypothetical protein